MTSRNGLLRQRATFHRMVDSTADDWAIVSAHGSEQLASVPANVVAHLRLLAGDYGGFAVDRLEHCLQTATRAMRAGKDDEYLACALIHDIGDVLAPIDHPRFAGAILSPYVSRENVWMVENHGVFQGYNFFHLIGGDRHAREQFRGHPWFDRTEEFCQEFDQAAFDPHYPSLPLEEFEPLLVSVLSRAPHPSTGWGAPEVAL